MTLSQKVVTPVKTGVQAFCNYSIFLDSGFRRNDGCGTFLTFYDFITFDSQETAAPILCMKKSSEKRSS
jgi:hypothetical protein